VKRYRSSELGETASRRVGYDWQADYAKSGRSTCKVCHKKIDLAELRLALMLQDEEGYKSTAWTHFDCFWKHREVKKLYNISEIHGFSKLKPADKKRIEDKFEEKVGDSSSSKGTTATTAKATATKKKKAKNSAASDDSDDEAYGKTKSKAKKAKSS